MKVFLLLICAIVFSLLLSEGILRCATPYLPKTVVMEITNGYPPMITFGLGYTLNPNSGRATQCRNNVCGHYHYYYPHLRDTQIKPHINHILVLGDSFTFGWLLNWPDTFIFHLQQDLNQTFGKDKYQLLNAGTPGWGTDDYLAYLEQYAARVSPQYVLIFINTDDIGRSMKWSLYHFKTDNTMALVSHFYPHPLLEYWKNTIFNSWIYRHSVLLKVVCFEVWKLRSDMEKPAKFSSVQNKGYTIPTSQDLTFNNKDAIHLGEAMFLRINQWCVQHHAKLLIVTTGFNAFYPADLHDPTKAFLSVAPSFFKKNNIPFFDSATLFQKMVYGKNIQIPIDMHPNSTGAAAIAAANWPWIKHQLAS